MRDGALADHAIHRPGAPDGVGDVHLARAGRRDANLGGTFVALAGAALANVAFDGPGPSGAGGLAEGFLPDRETARAPLEGEAIVVRIIRGATGGKGVRVSAKVDPSEAAAGMADMHGKAGPRLLRPGPTPLAELLARWPGAPVVVPTPRLAARIAPLAASIVPAPDDATETALEALREPAVALPGGARATIHPTPALVAIDVDGATARPSTMLAANRALLPRLLHEIRLRNLSGAIMIDLAGLPARKRQLLAPDVIAGLAPDPLRPRFLGFTALGLAEIVRARRRPPLHELFASPHARALDAVAALRATLLDAASRTFGLRVGPRLARLLAADRAIEADLAADTGRPLLLRADPRLAPDGWEVEEMTRDAGTP